MSSTSKMIFCAKKIVHIETKQRFLESKLNCTRMFEWKSLVLVFFEITDFKTVVSQKKPPNHLQHPKNSYLFHYTAVLAVYFVMTNLLLFSLCTDLQNLKLDF